MNTYNYKNILTNLSVLVSVKLIVLQEMERACKQIIKKNLRMNDEEGYRSRNSDLDVSGSMSSASSWLVESLLVDFVATHSGSLLNYWRNLMISSDSDEACSLQGCCFC